MALHIGLDHPADNGPRLLLADHHTRLEKAYEALRVAAIADDKADIVTRYRTLERSILEHLHAEEEMILPAYGDDAPEDAAVIRATHRRLREQLYNLGVEVELHTVRLATLEQLIETLRAHGRHEDRAMYPWAQVHLPLRSRRELFSRIAHSARALAHGAR